MSVGIFGPTGAVGRELLKLIEKRAPAIKKLRLFGSPQSVGGTLHSCPIEPTSAANDLDFAILCTDSAVSKELAPRLVKSGAIVIDHSSAFRMQEDVPLVIPEINPEALKNHRGLIASPNCTTTIMLMPLAPLHKKFGIKRIVAATYQAASGAGQAAMAELVEETRAHLEGRPFARKIMPHPYAFNLFAHNSAPDEEGYAEEENKLLFETRKILGSTEIQVTATCIRVPVLRAHSEALNVEFHQPVSKEQARMLIESAEGVTFLEDWKNNRFPMPSDATEEEPVFCGRLRQDRTQPNTLEMWVVGDQLLKGAALNSMQILECLL